MNRKKMDFRTVYIWIFLYYPVLGDSEGYKNVLLITADDLRPELGLYINQLSHKLFYTGIKTPNLDWLASRSAVFTGAFAQYPLCNPSRSSFLTGRYPRATRVLSNEQDYEKYSNLTAIPLYFKNAGYTTLGEGKIFHPLAKAKRSKNWSAGVQQQMGTSFKYKKHRVHWTLFENSWTMLPKLNNSKERYPEDYVSRRVSHYLRKIQDDSTLRKKPYFIAAGFAASHYSFDAPKQFFDLYPPSAVELASNQFSPKKEPASSCCHQCPVGLHWDLESKDYGVKRSPAMLKKKALELRRAYYSAISYMDYNVGIILQTLKDLNQLDKTIIAFVADHGLSLGENNHWCKTKILEIPLNVPLLISAPHLSTNKVMVRDIVELVDLYPTLIDLAGLPPLPKCSSFMQTQCLDGVSLAGAFRNSTTAGQVKQKETAFSVVQHNQNKKNKNKTTIIVGLSLRSKDYRYNLWLNMNKRSRAVDWEKPLGAELYAIRTDPEHNINVHNEPGYRDAIQKLNALMRKAWDGESNSADGLVASLRLRSNSSEPEHSIHVHNKPGYSDDETNSADSVVASLRLHRNSTLYSLPQFQYYQTDTSSWIVSVFVITSVVTLLLFYKLFQMSVPCFRDRCAKF